MIDHHAVEQMVVVLPQSAEIEVFLYWGLLESQLCETYLQPLTSATHVYQSLQELPSCLLDFVALNAGMSEAIGSKVFADVGRVRGIVVSFPVRFHKRVSHYRSSRGSTHTRRRRTLGQGNLKARTSGRPCAERGSDRESYLLGDDDETSVK